MKRGERYRLVDAEKAAVKEEIRAILIAAARDQRLLTYSDVCAQIQTALLHPGSYVFTHLLRQVCFEEEAKGSGILCALVVSKATGLPGAGYFRWAAAEAAMTGDLVAAWQHDVEAVYAIWSER